MGAAQTDSVDRLLGEILEVYPFLDPQVEAAVDRIGKLHRYLDNLWERTAEGYALNAGGYKVLICLRMEGVKTPGSLARDCSISTGAMTNRIDRLEQQGYVERVRDTADRRSVQVHITDAGIEVLERAATQQAKAEIDAMSTLDQGELKKLNGLLRKLMVAFETKGDLPKELVDR